MVLALDHVEKSFPGVRALKDASLTLAAGEIHALMGENGAGKSTIIKIITGVHRPDAGAVSLHGQAISLVSPRDAIALGISAVHQERNLIPRFSVAENILLETLLVKNGLIDFGRANTEARRHLRMVGLDIDPSMAVDPCRRGGAGMTRHTLIEATIGRAERPVMVRTAGPRQGAPKLEVRRLWTASGHRDISLTLQRGEILGLYGLVGAGRTETGAGASRQRQSHGRRTANRWQDGESHSSQRAIKRFRMGYVSEDRKHEGVILIHPIRSNIAMTVWSRIAKSLGLLTTAAERAISEPLSQPLEIRTPHLEQLVGNLSGGNQQKVSFAKWLAAEVDILIVDEPTVGIDIRAEASIHELLNGLADKGMAMLLISSDMPEMIALAGRILVMHDFSIVHELENDRRYDTASRTIMSAIHSAE